MSVAEVQGMEAGAAWMVLAGAWGAGLAATPHCLLMCGPLACVALPAQGSARWVAALSWHLGRLAAYAAMGAFLGAVSGQLGFLKKFLGTSVLTWVMVAALLMSAFNLTPKLMQSAAGGRLFGALFRKAQAWAPWAKAMGLGALTPLLPCSVLWAAFLIAVSSGGWALGAAAMALFAVGSSALLVAGQWQWNFWTRWPHVKNALLRVVPLGAAAALAWRATHPVCH